MERYSQPIHAVRTLVDRTVSGMRHLVWEGTVPSTPARHRWYIARTRQGALHFAYFHGLPTEPGQLVDGFLATDFGIHANHPGLGGGREECDILGSSCFYRGSQSAAAALLAGWVRQELDDDWLWEFLEARHAALFLTGDAHPSGAGADLATMQRRCTTLPMRLARRSQARATGPT